LSVVADGGQASWEESYWVSSDVNSSGFSESIEPFGPLFVSDSWSTESNDFDVIKLFGGKDVNETDLSQSSSQTNTSNNQSLGVWVDGLS